MGRLDRAASIDDLRAMARRRLPRFAFDFVDGGAESETGLARNRRALDEVLLAPRYMVGLTTIDTGIELFDRAYSVPLGIAPMGFINTAWPGADLMFARLAVLPAVGHVMQAISRLNRYARRAQSHDRRRALG